LIEDSEEIKEKGEETLSLSDLKIAPINILDALEAEKAEY